MTEQEVRDSVLEHFIRQGIRMAIAEVVKKIRTDKLIEECD